MRFFGLTATEFSLLFSCAAFLAVVFYLLSFRRRRAVLATEPIWRRVLGRRRTPFRKLLALLLQIAILFLLSLALADPRLESQDAQPPVAAVVVVDVSASMSALDGDRDRLAEAVELIEALAAEMGPRDRMLLVSMDDGCRPLTSWVNDPDAIGEALVDLKRSAVGEDFASAVSFAASALRAEGLDPRARRRVIVVSDRFHEPPEEDLSPNQPELLQVTVGQPRGNLAVTALEVRRRGGAARGHEVFVEVTNYGRRDRRVKLSIHTPDQLLGEERVTAPGRGAFSQTYFLKPIAGERLLATLTAAQSRGQADGFQFDDQAYALIPKRESRRVLLVTSGNLFLEMALKLDPLVDVEIVKPAAFMAGKLSGFQAVVFDGLCPKTQIPAVYFNPPAGGGCPVGTADEVAFPELLPLRGDHPVSDGVTMVDVRIEAARRLVPEAGDVELLADAGGPLVLARERAGSKMVAFGFDVARSDLPLRIAFPLMIHNCLAWFLGERPDLGSADLVVGGLASLPDWAGPAAKLVDPRGRVADPLRLGGRSLLRLRWPGFYELSEGRRRAWLPANFHQPDESNLTGDRRIAPDRFTWQAGPPPAELTAGFDKTELPEPPLQWPLVLLAAAWLLVFDWIFFCFRILF